MSRDLELVCIGTKNRSIAAQKRGTMSFVCVLYEWAVEPYSLSSVYFVYTSSQQIFVMFRSLSVLTR